VNPFPQVRTLPPDERIVSDPVSEVYGGRGGQQSWGGVLVSSSPWDLQSYKGVLVSPNVTMALEDTSRSPNQTAAILQRHLGPLLADEPARSLDLLRFDNVSCACDAAQAVLGGTAEAPARNPKLVVMQINPTLPPPVRIRVRSAGDERHEGAWGCSLAEATALLARFGYALVQLDYADAMFVLTAHASVIQGLPPNQVCPRRPPPRPRRAPARGRRRLRACLPRGAHQVSAYQLGFANRGERLRCLGLYRGTMNHPEGDVWARCAPASGGAPGARAAPPGAACRRGRAAAARAGTQRGSAPRPSTWPTSATPGATFPGTRAGGSLTLARQGRALAASVGLARRGDLWRARPAGQSGARIAVASIASCGVAKVHATSHQITAQCLLSKRPVARDNLIYPPFPSG